MTGDDSTATDDSVPASSTPSDAPTGDPQPDGGTSAGAGTAGGADTPAVDPSETSAEPVHDKHIETQEKYPNNRLFNWLDARLDLNHDMLGKAFPEDKYGSFLLGEIALFSFIILALTGTFLGLLYTPMAADVTYEGNAINYAGSEVPGAFASVLEITYDTPFGMFMRMAHHWAAYIFIAAIALHMFRVFFSGAYRNPHEPNWFIGSVLLLIALGEGFFGYALPFDNFSKSATIIGYQMTGSVPYLGETLQGLVFGGAFPDQAAAVLPRMFFMHVFLIPALLVGIIGLHMWVLMRQKHTEHAPSSRSGPQSPDADDESVVVGSPLFPQQFLLSLVVFLLTAAAIAFLAGLFPVQRIAVIGPADPASSPEGVSPDWFFMWVFGSLKMIPTAFHFGGFTLEIGHWAGFIGGVLLPMIMVGVMIAWPLIDNAEEEKHFTVDPLDRPLVTGLGVGAIILAIVLTIDGMKATFASVLGMEASALYPYLTVLTFVIPVLYAGIVWAVLKRRQNRLAAAES
jgi:cytochrome b-561